MAFSLSSLSSGALPFREAYRRVTATCPQRLTSEAHMNDPLWREARSSRPSGSELRAAPRDRDSRPPAGIPTGTPMMPAGTPARPAGTRAMPAGAPPRVPAGAPRIPAGAPRIPADGPTIPAGAPRVPAGGPRVPASGPVLPAGALRTVAGSPPGPGSEPGTPRREAGWSGRDPGGIDPRDRRW